MTIPSAPNGTGIFTSIFPINIRHIVDKCSIHGAYGNGFCLPMFNRKEVLMKGHAVPLLLLDLGVFPSYFQLYRTDYLLKNDSIHFHNCLSAEVLGYVDS